MADKIYDVVVIGAGISGLCAAKILHDDNVEVLVLEARDRVGGRTFTRKDARYQWCDLGGAYVGPTQDRILRVAQSVGVNTYIINTTGDYVHLSKGKATRFQGSWPRFWNPFAWLDVNNLFRKIDELIEEIDESQPWNCPHAEEWDNKTMQQFNDEVCWTEAAKEFARSFVNANVAMEPSEVSMLWFFWYVKGGGGSKRIWEVANGAQERKFLGGSQQISDNMAELLKGQVKLSKPVRDITQKTGIVEIITLDGNTYKARYVILALSPTLYSTIRMDPPLPYKKSQLIQRVPIGSVIKTNVYYKKPFWREKGMNGLGSAADGIEPICNCLDDVLPDNSLASLIGFVNGDSAIRLSQMTKDQRLQEILQCYARLFGSEEAYNYMYYEENNWMEEQYSKGCYTSTYPPGVMTRYGKVIREPHGRMYFAGTETAVKWSGYMDGAVEAGERAAREVLHAMGKLPQSQIWQPEPPSQECRVLPFDDSFMEKYAPSVGGFLKLCGVLTFSSAIFVTFYRHHELISKTTLDFFSKIRAQTSV